MTIKNIALQQQLRGTRSGVLRGGAVLALALICSTLSGCLVGGYSSGGGGFLWPGGLGGILLLVLLFLFLRGRR